MKQRFNKKVFAGVVAGKRKWSGLGLREAAKEIGISASTLSRIENEHIADLLTYNAICNWLNIDMNYFFDKKKL